MLTTTDDKIAILKQTELFRDLDEVILDVLARRAVLRHLGRNEILFLAGDPAKGMYVIASGSIRAFRTSPDGREQIIHVERAVTTIAEVPVFDGGNYPSTTAAEEPTTLYFLDKEQILATAIEHPQLALAAVKLLGSRLRRCAELVETSEYLWQTAKSQNQVTLVTPCPAKLRDNVNKSDIVPEAIKMKITRDSKIKEVLAFDQEKMIRTLMWLAPEFERLQYPKLRRAMAGRVSVSQAARIARIPLTEMLYVLNLAIGEDETALIDELSIFNGVDLQYENANLPAKPVEIAKVADTDQKVIFVDLMRHADEKRDPMPAITRGLVGLKRPGDILLLRHPFDPIPLREMFARRGFASWAEERKLGDWYIYFYRPALKTEASAHPPIVRDVYAKAFAAAAA